MTVSSFRFDRLIRAWSLNACLVLLMMALAMACGQRQPEKESASEITLDLTRKEAPLTLARETLTSSGLTLVFSLPADVSSPSGSQTLAVCLPPNIQPTLRLTGVRLGGQILPIGDASAPTVTPEAGPEATPESGPEATPEPTPEPGELPFPFLAGRDLRLKRDLGELEYVGLLRFWPVYRLTLPSAVLEPHRLARAEGQPMDYNFELAVEWSTATQASVDGTRPDAQATGQTRWRKMASRLVVNPDALDRYRQDSPVLYNGGQVAVTDPHRLWPGQRRWARMHVGRDGLYRLPLDELIKVGFASERVRAADVRVFSQGESVPMLIAPGEGVPDWLQPGVYFVGRKGRGEYSAEQVYWVTIDPELPSSTLETQDLSTAADVVREPLVRMKATVDRDQSLQRLHDNFQSIRGMHWVDAPVTDEEPFTLSLGLDAFVDGEIDSLDILLNFFISESISFSGSRVEVSADGKVLDKLQFYHARDLQKRVQVPATAVRDGRTTLTLQMTSQAKAPGETGLWFDRAEVVYPGRPERLEDHLELEPWSPEERVGWTPLAIGGDLRALALGMDDQRQPLAVLPIQALGDRGPGVFWNLSGRGRVEIWTEAAVVDAPPLEPVEYDDLADESQGGDYLIITHPEFREEAERLAEHRRSKGWHVRLTDIQNVYDAFSHGQQDPRAIRDLLAYSLGHWKDGAPACVLLVGDCSNDYLNVARNDVRNWVPTYTYTIGSDHWASDYWMTTVAGEDDLADFMIGRLSVSNRHDAAVLVDKIIDYDENPRPGPWRARLGYVADNGEFTDTIRDIRRTQTPPAYAAREMCLDDQPLEDNWYLPREYVETKGMKVSRAATSGILDIFRSGVAYLAYYGHGSPNIWGDERIWFGGDSPNSDNQHLAGSGFYTFVANMTCNTGTIDYPMPPWSVCITEDMMRVPGGGAIACFVPSGPGVTSIHRHMSDQLRRVMFLDDHVRQLGELTTLARLRYALNLYPRDLLYMYLLLGDPALELQMTSQWTTFELPRPVVAPGERLDFALTGLTPASGNWTAQLIDEQDQLLWETAEAASYTEGRLPLALTVPETADQGKLTLRLYVWNPRTGKDLALGCRMQVERPLARLDKLKRAEDGSPIVCLKNDGTLVAKGRVTFNLLEGANRREGTSIDVSVQAGEQREVSLDFAALGLGEAPARSAFEVVLDHSAEPADWAVARRETLLTPAKARPGRVDWVVPMCRFEMKDDSRRADLRVVAVAEEALGREVVAELVALNGDVVTTHTLQWRQDGPLAKGEGLIPLSSTQVAMLKGGRMTLIRWADGHGADPLDQVELDGLVRRASRLRIVPESIRQRPENPTEGETVFVDFEVENAGELLTPDAHAALLDNYKNQGGRLLDNQQNVGWVKIPVLASGRRYPLSLRWDPQHNAGEQRIFVQVVSGPGMISDEEADHTRMVIVKARTKPALAITRVWSDSGEEAIQAHRLTLNAEIINRGQTSAHRVLVTFYRSQIQTEENVLGEVEVESVPGDSTATASLVWEFDPQRDLGAGMKLPTPTVQLRLKGSSQRISSVEKES